jgi:hypothetical protein
MLGTSQSREKKAVSSLVGVQDTSPAFEEFLWRVSKFLDHVKLLLHSYEALKKGILEMRWIVFISWPIFKICTFNSVRDVTLLNCFKKKKKCQH